MSSSASSKKVILTEKFIFTNTDYKNIIFPSLQQTELCTLPSSLAITQLSICLNLNHWHYLYITAHGFT
jgi:hypothetical protein